MVNLERGRECCVGLSILLVYACRYLDSIQSKVTDEISCEKQCSFNEDFVCRSFAFYTSGWYGLELVFSDTPKLRVIRKPEVRKWQKSTKPVS